jgi:hypothetical protein
MPCEAFSTCRCRPRSMLRASVFDDVPADSRYPGRAAWSCVDRIGFRAPWCREPLGSCLYRWRRRGDCAGAGVRVRKMPCFLKPPGTADYISSPHNSERLSTWAGRRLFTDRSSGADHVPAWHDARSVRLTAREASDDSCMQTGWGHASQHDNGEKERSERQGVIWARRRSSSIMTVGNTDTAEPD